MPSQEALPKQKPDLKWAEKAGKSDPKARPAVLGAMPPKTGAYGGAPNRSLRPTLDVRRDQPALELTGWPPHLLTEYTHEIVEAAKSARPRNFGNIQLGVLQQIFGASEPLFPHISEHRHTRFGSKTPRKMIRCATQLPRQRFHSESGVRQSGADQLVAMTDSRVFVRFDPAREPLGEQHVRNHRDSRKDKGPTPGLRCGG